MLPFEFVLDNFFSCKINIHGLTNILQLKQKSTVIIFDKKLRLFIDKLFIFLISKFYKFQMINIVFKCEILLKLNKIILGCVNFKTITS